MSTISVIIMNTRRSVYSAIDAIDRSLTVKELIDILGEYNPNSKIIFSNDNGYTYGEIKEYDINEHKERTDSIVAHDIVWEVDSFDFDNEEDFEEVLESLPDEVKIPDDVDEEDIADYLSDEFGYLVSYYSIDEND